MMVVLVLAIVALAVIGVILKVIPIVVGIVAVFAAILFAGWRFDRARTRSGGQQYEPSDPNRPDWYGRAEQWEVPTAYIDHRTGTGPPPGVERGDEPLPRR